MQSFTVVVGQVVINGSLVGGDGWDEEPETALLLDGPVEPLQVAIVVGPTDAAVPMGEATAPHVLGEPRRELTPVIRLERTKRERRVVLGFSDKGQAPMGIDPWRGFGPGPP